MATVPLQAGAAGVGVACLAAAAGAKSWLRAHKKSGGAGGGDVASFSLSSPPAARGPCLEPGHAVALFDGASMLTVTRGAGGRGPGVELRSWSENENAGEIPAFPAEALFVVVEGHAKGGASVCLRSVG